MHSNREPLAKLAEVTRVSQADAAVCCFSHHISLLGISRLSERGRLINPVYLVMRSQLELCPVLGILL